MPDLPTQLGALAVADLLSRSENPIGAPWVKWPPATTTGRVEVSGYAAINPFVSGGEAAIYQSGELSGGRMAAVVKLTVRHGITERYWEVYVAAKTTGGGQGYRLWAEETATDVYKLRLERWTAGALSATLKEAAGIAVPVGGSLALSLYDGALVAWTRTSDEAVFAEVLTASDSNYTAGFGGIGIRGNIARLRDFRVGVLTDPAPAPPTGSRDRFVAQALRYDPALLYAPKGAAVPTPNLGTLDGFDLTYPNGVALGPAPIIGGVSAKLDGSNDYGETGWATRTNLATNPSLEVNTAGWYGLSSPTLSRDTSEKHSGAASLKVVCDGSGSFEGAGIPAASFTVGNTYTGSAYVKGKPGAQLRVLLIDNLGSSQTTFEADGTWQRISVSRAVAVGATELSLEVRVNGSQVTTFNVDDALLERSAVVGEYFPTAAQLESGEAGWSGTAHASASDIGPFARGTGRTFVVLANRTSKGTDDSLLNGSGTSDPFFGMDAGTENLEFGPSSEGSVSWANAWPGESQTVFAAVAFDDVANSARAYVNGVDLGSKELAFRFAGEVAGSLRVGSSDHPFHGSIIPFAVFLKALSVHQIEELWRCVKGSWPRVAVTRQYPPNKHAIIVRDPRTGAPLARWAEDEARTQNVMNGLRLSGAVPGGKKELRCVLPRNPRQDWPDQEGFLEIECQLPGRNRIWHGRIGKAPRSDGERMVISNEAVGYAAALEDRKALRLGFIDSDLSKWGEPSTMRRQRLVEAAIKLVAATSVGLSSKDLAATAPAVINDFTGVTADATITEAGEAHYYGGGPDIGRVLYDYNQLTSYEASADWESNMALGLTDSFVTFIVGANHQRTHIQQNQQVVDATGPGYKFARVRDRMSGGTYTGVLGDVIAWQNLKVISLLARDSLALQGTWPDVGYSIAQILRLAIPLYSELKATADSVEDDGLIVGQAWYTEPPGTLAQIVDELIKLSLYDWFVKDAKLFELRQPGSYGRRWQAYQGPSNFEESGTDTDRLWDRIVVAFQEPDGTTRYVGWPGSGADLESPSLQITDPGHPAVRAGTVREDLLELRTMTTASRAVSVGERWLSAANELPRSGKATLSDYVMDDHGVFHSVSEVAEGDLLRFPDARDKSYRKIASYDNTVDDGKCVVDLDAPSESLQALLERFRAVLTPLGVR